VAFAVALPISVGVNYGWSLYLSRFNIRQTTATYVVLIVILVSISIAFQRRHKSISSVQSGNTPYGLLEVLSVSVIGIVLLITWYRSAQSLSITLPNHDAMYHSYAIRNILNFGNIAPNRALQIFPVGSGSAANFYPLGIHDLMARAVAVTGVSIPGAMNLVALLFGACWFPLSISLFCRELFSDRRVTCLSPCAVLLVAPVFPWSPFSWGGLPTIVGMSVVPAAAVAVYRLLNHTSIYASLVMATIFVGMFSLHTPELLSALLLAALMWLAIGEGLPIGSQLLKHLFRSGAFAALLIAPVLHNAVSGVQERNIQYQSAIDSVTLGGQIATSSLSGYSLLALSALLLLCLAVARSRQSRILLIGLLVLDVTVYIAGTHPTNSLVKALLKPWYGQVLRINYNTAYLIVPLIAGVLVECWEMTRRTSARRVNRFLSSSALVAILVLGTAATERGQVVSGALLKSWYSQLVPVNKNSIAAYSWMKQHMSTSDYVMTDKDTVDESLWMYAIANIRPIVYSATTADSRDRYLSEKSQIITSIGHLSSHPQLVNWIDSHNVKYLYFDERTNAVSAQHSFGLVELRSETTLREVFSLGNAHVFEFTFS